MGIVHESFGERNEVGWPFGAVRKLRRQPETLYAQLGGEGLGVALVLRRIEVGLDDGEAFGDERGGFSDGRVYGHGDTLIRRDFAQERCAGGCWQETR